MPNNYSMEELIEQQKQAGEYQVVGPKKKKSAFTPQQGVVSSGRIAAKLADMKKNGTTLTSPAKGQSAPVQTDLPAPPQSVQQPMKMPTDDFRKRFWESNERFARNLLGE